MFYGANVLQIDVFFNDHVNFDDFENIQRRITSN